MFYKQGVGVNLNGVGNRASHNLIHDGPRMGIMFSGNNLVIEYNQIRHMNLETEDTGAVYTGGRDWISSRGTVIRYNYFHDGLRRRSLGIDISLYTFRYLNQLGSLARLGVQVQMENTLNASDYGLLDEENPRASA